MYVAYLDEAGSTGRLDSAMSAVQPVFIPAAVICKQSRVKALTMDFLHLKKNFYPGLIGGKELFLDRMLSEIKGSELRRNVRKGRRRRRRHALGFLDKFMDILDDNGVEVVGRVWVKGIGSENNSKAMYTYSVQDICAAFQHLLCAREAKGFVIADSRNYLDNKNLSHSIFTKKFSSQGDEYSRIMEMPTFGHSDNHAGLQIADILCSAILFPISTFCYCHGKIRSVHVHKRYQVFQKRYADRLKGRLYIYRDVSGKVKGGITVSDRLGRKSASHLWRNA